MYYAIHRCDMRRVCPSINRFAIDFQEPLRLLQNRKYEIIYLARRTLPDLLHPATVLCHIFVYFVRYRSVSVRL